jgi:hypothetical protein
MKDEILDRPCCSSKPVPSTAEQQRKTTGIGTLTATKSLLDEPEPACDLNRLPTDLESSAVDNQKPGQHRVLAVHEGINEATAGLPVQAALRNKKPPVQSSLRQCCYR